MKKEILYLGVAAAMLAGCSTSSKLTRANVVEETSGRVVTEKIKLSPEGDPETAMRQQVWNQQKAAMETAAAQAVESFARRPREDRPAMAFTHAQCEYLQIAGINPLPASGVLELDLNAMAAEFCYPLQGALISPYGRRGSSYHTGLDIKAMPNDTIRAALPGVVRMAKVYSAYGNLVAIRHYEGFETVYAHGSKLLVKENDVVEPGDPIMLAGRTGRATTEHLHFEVRAGDSHIDPARLIDTQNRSLRSGKLYIAKLDGRLVAYTDELELQQLKGAKNIASAPAQAPAPQQPVQPVVAGPVETDNEAFAVARVSEQARQPAVKPEVNIVANSTPETPNAAVYYRVQKGDTLSAIARQHSTTVAKICQLSNITPNALLQINQRLRVK